MEVYQSDARPSTLEEYKNRDTDGRLIATHHCKRLPDGGKRMWWSTPQDPKGLGGMKVEDLPLYNAHLVQTFPEDEIVVLSEGEAAAQAAYDAGLNAVGTVTGAGGCPSPESLAALKGRRVAVWPDGDDPGRSHMERVAAALQGVAAEVRWFDWKDAPEGVKGPDAADHPAVISKHPKALDRLVNELEGAPRYIGKQAKERGLKGRVLLGRRIAEGVEPPEQLVEGMLYAGRIHSLNGEPGVGKTILALHAALDVVRQGKPVLYLDAENGPNLIGERLEEMGAEPAALDEHFHYYQSDESTLDREALADLMATVEEVEPALVVFDSLPDFLALAGLNENDAGDVTRWMLSVAQPIKDAGASVLLLDHLVKSPEGAGRYARGSGAKLSKVDVAWGVKLEMPFDRESVGEVKLVRRKDREGWLPERTKFAIGGDGRRLIVRPSEGVIEQASPADGLTPSQGRAYEAIKASGDCGTTWKLLSQEIPSKGTLSRSLKELTRRKMVRKEGVRYYDAVPLPMEPLMEPGGTAEPDMVVEPENGLNTPNEGGSIRFHSGSTEPNGTGAPVGVPLVPPPYKGGTVEPPGVEPGDPDPLKERIDALRTKGRS